MEYLQEIMSATVGYKEAKATRDTDRMNAIYESNPNFQSAVKALKKALREDDVNLIAAFVDVFPDFFSMRVGIGPNIYMAATYESPKMVALLLQVGCDPNEPRRHNDPSNALHAAAGSGSLEIVEMLHNAGAILDTSHINANPLFASVTSYVKPENRERCLDVAQYLLDAGIDSTVTYKTSRPLPMSAIDFAWMYGARHIARATAIHQTGGDEAATEALLAEAARKADLNTRGGEPD